MPVSPTQARTQACPPTVTLKTQTGLLTVTHSHTQQHTDTPSHAQRLAMSAGSQHGSPGSISSLTHQPASQTVERCSGTQARDVTAQQAKARPLTPGFPASAPENYQPHSALRRNAFHFAPVGQCECMEGSVAGRDACRSPEVRLGELVCVRWWWAPQGRASG